MEKIYFLILLGLWLISLIFDLAGVNTRTRNAVLLILGLAAFIYVLVK